jgi:hypothetical protein
VVDSPFGQFSLFVFSPLGWFARNTLCSYLGQFSPWTVCNLDVSNWSVGFWKALSAKEALGLQQKAWSLLKSLTLLVFDEHCCAIFRLLWLTSLSIYLSVCLSVYSSQRCVVNDMWKATDVDDGYFGGLFPL